jgi:hypothetical protein
MKLILTRILFLEDRTIGRLFIDDLYFCDTLEDKNRDLNKNGEFDNKEYKLYGETCIPFGEYKIKVTYSPKFKRNLPILLNVPSFDGIRIHRGNYVKDTLGCILVGELDKNNNLINSTKTENKLVSILKKEKEISIEII